MKKFLSSPGFSLIEILSVISIVGIMAAMALPAISGASSWYDLEMTAQNLVSDIRLTQQLSMNSGGDNIYTLYCFSSKNSPSYYLISGNTGEIKRVYLPSTVTFGATSTPIRFSLRGIPTNNSANTITLKNSNNRRLYVTLAPVTGRVRSFTY